MRRHVLGLAQHDCRLVSRSCHSSKYLNARGRAVQTRFNHTQDVSSEALPQRLHHLREEKAKLWPRFKASESEHSCSDFVQKYQKWAEGGFPESSIVLTVHGRIAKIRSAGSKLIFIDIVADTVKTQAVCNQRTLEGISNEDFKTHFQSLQRGDIIKLTGRLYKTSSGEPSIRLDKLPELLSPCLHPLPTDLQDAEVIVGKRHVGFLANQKASSLIRAKSSIVQGIRQFLLNDDHIEVQTPLLADAAGGAIARPFRTKATEFLDRELALRIAPELWLKRMVVGGFDRVFEIGPSFRNEGIDLTHNPEFMICEFYRAYTDLDGLISMTEEMFEDIYQSITSSAFLGLEHTVDHKFAGPYQKIDFITGIEQAIGAEIPTLSAPGALQDLKAMVTKLSLPIQNSETMNLPQLLDKLCGRYLEPQCQNPTFITGHPECMSPLSKSLMHPTRSSQKIAARAELFVNGQELANMYEEENSPLDQRRKFIEQSLQKGDETMQVDEAYLEALEWGMPPVGGWGCGIERLTMAMTGATRISDVLSFGTLRNVISKHLKK